MRARHVIHVVSCHAEGEVGDVIVGGVAPPPVRPSGSRAASSPKTGGSATWSSTSRGAGSSGT